MLMPKRTKYEDLTELATKVIKLEEQYILVNGLVAEQGAISPITE